MYTLRKITSEGIQLNFFLGSIYTVTRKDRSPEVFKQKADDYYQKSTGLDELDIRNQTYALVSNELGNVIIPLLEKQENYIMTERGETFSNLTLK